MTNNTAENSSEDSGPNLELCVVADENMASLDALVKPVAQLRTSPGRDIGNALLEGADALLVRSITQVNKELLDNSRIRFVGSATIGTDHIDLPYLQEQGIRFANAPGSNADSVADYVCSALAALIPDLGSIKNKGLKAGVIGYGQVGSRVVKRLQALGYTVLAYDPLIPCDSNGVLASLEEVLSSDVISVHVPLTNDGGYPTYHMLDDVFLSKLQPNTLLINTSRGEVADNSALKRWLDSEPGAHAVLDVWEYEPDVDPMLLRLTSIGTAHIAGYALDGKIRGTAMLMDAFKAFFSSELSSTSFSRVRGSELQEVEIKAQGNETLNQLLLLAYDIRRDDAALRQSVLTEVPHHSDDTNLTLESLPSFDELRKYYPVRREFSRIHFVFEKAPDKEISRVLVALGFSLSVF